MRKAKPLMAIAGGLAILFSFINGTYYDFNYYALALIFAISAFLCVIDRLFLTEAKEASEGNDVHNTKESTDKNGSEDTGVEKTLKDGNENAADKTVTEATDDTADNTVTEANGDIDGNAVTDGNVDTADNKVTEANDDTADNTVTEVNGDIDSNTVTDENVDEDGVIDLDKEDNEESVQDEIIKDNESANEDAKAEEIKNDSSEEKTDSAESGLIGILTFLEVTGKLSPFIVLAQIALQYFARFWREGFVPVQALTHTFYVLAIAFLVGGMIEMIMHKPLFSIDMINGNGKVLFGLYAITLFAGMFVTQLSVTYALVSIPNQELLFQSMRLLPLAVSVFIFAINFGKNCGWLSSLLLLTITVLVYISLYRTSAFSFCAVYILAVGMVAFKDRALVKVAFVSSLLTLATSFMLSMSGVITSLVSKSSDGFKHNFGFYNPNPASMLLASTVILYLYLRNRKSIFGRIIDLLLIAAVAVFIRYYTGGRTSVLGLAYLFAGTVVYDICRLLPASLRNKCRKVLAVLNFIYAEIVLFGTAAFGIWFSYIYDKYNDDYLVFRIIGKVFNTRSYGARLNISHDGLMKYKTGFFGLLPNSNFDELDFVGMDVFYVRIYLVCGVLMLSCFLIFMTVYYYRLAKRGHFYKMYLLSTFSVLGLTEALVGELMYNVFPAVSMATIDDADEEMETSKATEEHANKGFDFFYRPIIPLLGIGVWGLLLPSFLSWLRTVTNGYGISKSTSILMVISIIGFIMFITWSTARAIFVSIEEKAITSTRILVLVRNVLAIGITFVVATYAVFNLRDLYIGRIGSAVGIIKAISDCSEGEVFVDNVPDAYDKKFAGISETFFYGDELAFNDNIALITDTSNDYTIYFSRGFVYTPISEYDAVYTNDSAVITTLEKRGFNFTGYCTYVNTVNLPYEIWRNRLESTVDGLAILKGPSHSLARGPFVETNATSYSATFDLYLDNMGYSNVYPDDESDAEDYQGNVVSSADDSEENNSVSESYIKEDPDNPKICTLKIQGKYGEVVANVKDLYANDFDENGHLLYTMSFTGRGEGTEFLVLMEEGQSLLVNEITYTRIASYDRRLETDARGNTLHEEFLDEEGNPFRQSAGHYGADYEYDKDDRRIKTVYLDENNNPMNVNDGYAECRVKYDEKGNAIEYTYYDADGNATLVQGYYFKETREYDRDNRLIRQVYRGFEDEPVLTKNGSAGCDREYDEDNNVSSLLYLGTDLKPIMITSGYAREEREFNEKKQVTRYTYYDDKGERVALSPGQSSLTREYDENGNVTVECYFGTNDEPVLYNGNYWKIVRVYNEKKQNIHEEYYDTDDKMMLLAGGYAGINRRYTDAGDVSELTHIGLDGEPIMNTSGYSIWKKTYNEKRQALSLSYFDTEGKPVDVGGGRASEEYEYDESGNVSAYTYFGVNGERIMLSGNWWKDSRVYNEKRQMIHREFYDTADQPVLVSGSYFSIDYEYDENGTWKTRKYYDLSGTLVSEEKNEG